MMSILGYLNLTKYTDRPNFISDEIQSRLDAFKNASEGYNVGLFVQTTRRITEHDYKLLTKVTSERTKEPTLSDF